MFGSAFQMENANFFETIERREFTAKPKRLERTYEFIGYVTLIVVDVGIAQWECSKLSS